MMRYFAPLVAPLVALLCIVSCGGTPAGPNTTGVNLQGAWHYVGLQTSNSRVSYDGTLTMTQQTGTSFTGGLDARSTTPEGIVLQVNAVVSGRLLSATAVDFDVQFIDDTRRHVGTIKGDSIKGNWVNDDLSSLGSFTMARTH